MGCRSDKGLAQGDVHSPEAAVSCQGIQQCISNGIRHLCLGNCIEIII